MRFLWASRESLDIGIFTTLSELCGDLPLFPELRELDWTQERQIHPELGLFLSDRLELIRLECLVSRQYPQDPRSRRESDEVQVFHLITERAPHVQVLNLIDITVAPEALQLIPLLQGLRHLEMIHLNHHVKPGLGALDELGDLTMPGFMDLTPDSFAVVNSHFLLGLPTMSNLGYMSLNVDGIEDTDLELLGEFVCLKTLRVFGAIRSQFRFLSYISAPHLQILMLLKEYESHNVDEWADFRDCIEIISDRWKLTLVRFVIARSLKHRTDPRAPLMYILEPLLRVTQLQALQIDAVDYFSLSDDDILTMIRSWPELYDLRVANVAGQPKPSFISLGLIANYANLLRNLQLEIDCSLQPLEVLQDIPIQHRISEMTLNLTNPSRCNTEVFSHQVVRIFPCINKAPIPHDNDVESSLGWGLVNRDKQTFKFPAKDTYRTGGSSAPWFMWSN